VAQGPFRSVPPTEIRRTAPPTAAPVETSGADPLELVGFALRAARRHWTLCLAVWVAASALGIGIVYALPLTYESTAKFYITQNNAVTAALANGRRQDDSTGSLRGLQESVISQDNLISMIREAKLADRWPQTRTWALRLKDSIQTSLVGPPSTADTERALLDMLKISIWVNSEDNTSIRFTAHWRNAQDAFTLVDLARRNFFAGRSSDQFSAIKRAISVLELQLKQADDAVEPAVKEMQALVLKASLAAANVPKAPAAGSNVAGLRPRQVAPQKPLVASSDLVSSERLQEVRRAERALSEPWQRRQADLRVQMAELRTVFGPAHPLVAQQEAKLLAASELPAELAKLKQEEAALTEQLTTLGTAPEPAAATEPRRIGGSGSSAPIITLDRPEDPEVAAARTRVEATLSKAREFSQRLDAVRLEFATAEAGEKYRYSVVEAPEVPRKPIKPKRPVLLAAALAVALLLGFIAGALRELSTGQLLESWQVRRLGLELLGDVELPNPKKTSLRNRA